MFRDHKTRAHEQHVEIYFVSYGDKVSIAWGHNDPEHHNILFAKVIGRVYFERI